MVRHMKGLEKVIDITVVHPVWERTKPDDENDTHKGWVFGEPGVPKTNSLGHGSFAFDDVQPDTLNGSKYVRDLYTMSGIDTGRYSVPILWDTKTKQIVNNESSEIVLMLNSGFNEFAEKPELDLAPADLKEKMDDVDPWIYDGINNGVYKCGFARTQGAYDGAIVDLYAALDKLEAHLSDKKFLTGDTFSMSDIRLFVTLIRFDEVYVVYFKCDQRKISEYPNIFRYCKEVWKIPGVKETTKMDQIKGHYYTSHADMNTYAIIPKGPNFIGQLEKE